ncbi:MAG TPA: hypothetical protein VFU21_05720, partial [Kofleriaceae bacterium]|nr:hypothetical protein [Kofleriaceae bacterium]
MGTWRQCSSCRAAIGFEQIYWECSVSTCARVARTGLFFCSVSCWEAHLPTMRHREAWAVEKRSPTAAAWQRQLAEDSGLATPAPAAPAPAARPAAAAPVRTAAPAPARAEGGSGQRIEARRQVVSPPPPADEEAGEDDILVVVSKLKKYIRARSGMNTSDNVMPVLSDHLRRVCERAIQK